MNRPLSTILNHSSWLLAIIAGYGVAAAANIAMFVVRRNEAMLSYSDWSRIPGLLAVPVACWFVRHQASRARAAAAGMGVALALALSAAPLTAGNPLSWSIRSFPGDFLFLGLVFIPVSAASLVLVPGSVLLLLPVVAYGGLCAALMQTPSVTSSRTRRVRLSLTGLLIGGALLVEGATTPSVWSPRIHHRITDLELPVPPGGTSASHYRAWARQQLNFTLSAGSSAEAALLFYEDVFNGWRRLDRTTDDAIWVDPTGTVLAWVYSVDHRDSSPGRGRPVQLSLTDLHRAAWQHRFRRSVAGERISDLISDVR